MSGDTGVDRREALQDRREQFRRLIEIRAVENAIQDLFAQGLVRGSTHLCIGQEAVSVGLAMASRTTDVVCGTYRGHGLALALGVTPLGVIGEILGRVVGCAGGLGGSMHLCDMSVGLYPTSAIVGAGIPTAVGVGLTARVRGTDMAGIAVFGDGTSNIGTFHESLNLAAIWGLPVVFVCENNLYGEYSRINLTTPIDDIADRAASYGMPGYVVDGQSVDAVAEAMSSALARARAGEGPTLLEMKTYRYSGHSRSDPATYRPDGELEAWRRRDPIDLLEATMIGEGVIHGSDRERIEREVAVVVEQAIKQALKSPEPPLSAMFEHVSGRPRP
jgi:TPP-dependent pyruvate/acetoin dehydrogenase alpha subunit